MGFKKGYLFWNQRALKIFPDRRYQKEIRLRSPTHPMFLCILRIGHRVSRRHPTKIVDVYINLEGTLKCSL